MAEQTIQQPEPSTSSIQLLIKVLEAAPVAIVTVDAGGEIIFVNSKLAEMFDYASAELRGQMIERLIPKRLWKDHVDHRTKFMKTPTVRTMGSGLDLVGQRKDGSEFPLEVGLSPVQVGQRTVTMGLVTDITYRREVEERLEQRVAERTREIEQRRRVAEGVRHILAVLNSNQTLEKTLEYVVTRAGLLMDANASILYRFHPETKQAEIAAYNNLRLEADLEIDALIGRDAENQTVYSKPTITISDLMFDSPHNRALLERGYQALLAVQILIKDEVYGGLTWYFANPTEFSAETVQLAMTLSDQAALAIENDRLRVQVSENAVVAERNRIARDLHDSVSQTLFSANLIAEVLPRLWKKNPNQAQKSTHELHELTRGALAEMRTLLFELRPTTLQEVPITDILHQIRDAIIARARLAVELHIEGDANLPIKIKIAFFYIAQEALNNIVKHARANIVTIELLRHPERFQLQITDDGCGFDPKSVPPDHLGLRIMHERTEEIGGSITVESVPNRGTKVTVIWQNG